MSSKSVLLGLNLCRVLPISLAALGFFALIFSVSCNAASRALDDDQQAAAESSESTEAASDASEETSLRETFNWSLAASATNVDPKKQFRVDNVVKLTRNERETSFKSSTVYYGDLVFDFVGDNGEIVVYSFSEKKFALIDPIRRMRTELELDEIDRFLSRVKPILTKKNDKFVDFMLAPSFEISTKEEEFFFQSKYIDYHVTTSSFESAQAAEAYFDFADALGKLNVYMNPGTVTPLARIEANKKLADASRFPERIVTDVYPNGKKIFNKTVHIANESSLARRLSERDKNRVNRTIHFFAQFPLVNFQHYFEKTSDR